MDRREAAQMLLDADDAADSLLRFVEFTHPTWTTGEHHKTFAAALEAVERGDTKRLIVESPPRHGKSELVSRRFPAWCIGRHPTWQLITASYAAELATDLGRNVRDIVGSDLFRLVFPGVGLRPDSRAANRWHTAQGGIYTAAGLGGTITGRGAHILVIDDPIKDRWQADSPTYRERAWSWYQDVARTRLMPGGAVVVVMTRWHDDDLVARLLEPPGGIEPQDWTRVTLPAISNEGTDDERALWPEWYDLEYMREVRATTPPRTWRALYQQRPASDDGEYIRRKCLVRQPPPPLDHMTIYGCSDYAVREKDISRAEPDFTEHGVIGVDSEMNLHILDWWRGQTHAGDWIGAQLDLFERWKPRVWFGEGGVIRHAINPLLDRMCRERRAFFQMHWVNRTVDKVASGRAFQGMAELGRVWVEPGSRYEDLIDQWCRFPTGRWDDGFDAMANLCLGLEEMMAGSVPVAPSKPHPHGDYGYRERRSKSWRVA